MLNNAIFLLKSDNGFQWFLLTRCGKTYLRVFLSWIAGRALSMKFDYYRNAVVSQGW